MPSHRFAVAASLLLVLVASFPPAAPRASEEGASDTVMPRILESGFVQPEYPEDAARAGAEGRVVLAVVIRTDGTAGEASVVEDVPEFPSFAASAREAVEKWRFAPGRRAGRAVDMQVKIPIEFRLADCDHDGGAKGEQGE